MEPRQLVLAVAPPDDGRDHRPADLILRFAKHIFRKEFANLLNMPNHFSCFSIIFHDLGLDERITTNNQKATEKIWPIHITCVPVGRVGDRVRVE